jgi:hypothetical protein
MASSAKALRRSDAAHGQDLRGVFAAAGTDWSKQVGNTLEVKGDWWEGGTASDRRKWFKVKVMSYNPAYQFEVVRKGQPKSTRLAKALRIRVVDNEEDEEDAWMDVAQYQKYLVRWEDKQKSDSIVDNARGIIERGLAAEEGPGAEGAAAAEASDAPQMTEHQQHHRYTSVMTLLVTTMMTMMALTKPSTAAFRAQSSASAS